MNCAHCGQPIKPGRPSLPAPWVYAGARMHPPCMVRSEAGEQPPTSDNGSRGVWQLLDSRADRRSTLQRQRESQAREQLERMADHGGS